MQIFFALDWRILTGFDFLLGPIPQSLITGNRADGTGVGKVGRHKHPYKILKGDTDPARFALGIMENPCRHVDFNGG